jgi:predicted RNase H-like HicB family nuclease
MEYIAYLHKNRDSDYGVSFPDFPGCITAGKTLDEASRLAPEALALHIAGMIEDGDAVPEPSKLDDVAAEAAGLTRSAYAVRSAIGEKKRAAPVQSRGARAS